MVSLSVQALLLMAVASTMLTIPMVAPRLRSLQGATSGLAEGSPRPG